MTVHFQWHKQRLIGPVAPGVVGIARGAAMPLAAKYWKYPRNASRPSAMDWQFVVYGLAAGDARSSTSARNQIEITIRAKFPGCTIGD